MGYVLHRLHVAFSFLIGLCRRCLTVGIVAVAHILRRQLIRPFKQLHLVGLPGLLRHGVLHLQLINPCLQFGYLRRFIIVRHIKIL